MKRKLFTAAAMTAVFVTVFAIPAFAGPLQKDSVGWWYLDADGASPSNEWKELDGKWYYFDANGYAATSRWIDDTYYVGSDGAMIVNGTTPDGYKVDESGARTGKAETGSGGGWGSDSWDFYSGDDDWESGYSWWSGNGWTNDPLWYEKDESLSEGDKASYHYQDTYYQWDESKNYGSEYMQRVAEQCARIEANPCHETAVAEMTWVEIPVWRLRNGQKVPDTTRVQVLSSIADEVREIFTEIYNGPEQFPINSIGGYAWRSNGLTSNHSSGLAIDINPDENPQVRADGTVLVGNKWEPGVNPYSIGRDSDVLKAFGKHGWGWGASFTTKDYMHFDY